MDEVDEDALHILSLPLPNAVCDIYVDVLLSLPRQNGAYGVCEGALPNLPLQMVVGNVGVVDEDALLSLALQSAVYDVYVDEVILEN